MYIWVLIYLSMIDLNIFIFVVCFFLISGVEGNVMYSICSYIAETKDALNLVEGEKVFVLGMF